MGPGYSKRGTREQIEHDDYEEAIFSSIALGYHAEANKVLGNLHNRLQGVFGSTGENQIVRQSGPDRDHQPPRPSHLPPPETGSGHKQRDGQAAQRESNNKTTNQMKSAKK